MASLIVTLGALGETAVGAIILLLPRETTVLLVGVALEAGGLIVARILGCAVLALGITWWMARGDFARFARLAPGFVVYNVGVGLLFGLAALVASRPALPWIVCVAHLALGSAFVVAMLTQQSLPKETREKA